MSVPSCCHLDIFVYVHVDQYSKNSLTTFQTELSYDSGFVKHLLDGKHVTLPNLRAKLIVNDCVNDMTLNAVWLPKSVYTNQNDNQLEFSQQVKKRLAKKENVDLTNLEYLNGYKDSDVSYFESSNTHYLYIEGIVKFA